jgi:putative ABC transport system permease protein
VFTLAIKGVRHNVGRYIATLVAIMTGVAFFTATGFLSQRVIDSLEGSVDQQYGAVDVALIVDASDADSTGLAEQLVLSQDVLDQMDAIDGVDAVAGEVTGPVAFQGEGTKVFGEGATGRLWVTDDELNPLDVTEGEAPTAEDEIAVDVGLAEQEDLTVGDDVTILSVGGPHEATIVGLTDFGSADSIDQGGTVSLPQDAVFDVLTSGRVEYQNAYLRGSGSATELTEAVAEIASKGFVAQSGDDFRADQREQAGAFGKVLKNGLQAFAILALLVGGFVIYNTFSVIIAQRQRELAVLSAIGATPKQLKRSLRFEGILIGLLGSALGVAVGFGLTFVLFGVLELVGVSLPGSGIAAPPGTIVGGILIGTIITVSSVMIPARRAAKIEPIEALRDAATESGAVTRSRRIWSIVLLVGGLLGLFLGSAPAIIGLGALLLIVGALVAGPFIALGGARLLRPVLGRLGLEGQLAADNATRSPKRTATTANALLIGVFLVTFVTVAGGSLKDFAVREIQKLESADFIVASTGGTLDDQLLADLGSTEGVDAVTPFRRESVTLDGQPSLISSADIDDLTSSASLEVADGSLDDLDEGTIAIADTGETGGAAKAVGDTVTVANADGKEADLKVVAILEPSLDTAQVGQVVALATFEDLVGDTAPTVALVDAADGTESDTQSAIEDLVASRPDISVTPGNAIGQLIGTVFDFLINAINGLLLMSVVIALIGIVNTLSLSILERRRELGLLRIIGMVDRRVQRMVRLESVIISTLGTASGIVLGLVVGYGLIAAINRLSDASIGLTFPGPLLVLILVLGVVLGFLASILPARRSTRLDVLDAVQAG